MLTSGQTSTTTMFSLDASTTITLTNTYHSYVFTTPIETVTYTTTSGKHNQYKGPEIPRVARPFSHRTLLTTRPPTPAVTEIVAPTPTATFYAQCGDNNMASLGPKGSLYGLLDYDGSQDIYVSEPSSSYDCCVACLLDPLCAWSAFALFDTGRPPCMIREHTVCAHPGQFQYPINEDTTATEKYYEYFNGNCVQVVGYAS